jgi:putative DNA primase/helicase
MSAVGISPSEVASHFLETMARAGLVADVKPVPDGEIHRFHVEGDRPGSMNGWYILNDGPHPEGVFGSWKLGNRQTWRADTGARLSREEQAALKKRRQDSEAKYQAERERIAAKARREAEAVWKLSAPVSAEHPYLQAKRIQAHGARLHDGRLVLPLRDVDGTLHSLQFISPTREKRFLAGGRIQGCCYLLGEVRSRIYVAEGFATGAAIYEVTGEAVAVAFNAGNLRLVAEAIRQRRPQIDLVIAADDDRWTDGNPGKAKAIEAARAARANLALPHFRSVSTCPTDFNDLLALEGTESVKQCLQRACAPDLLVRVPGVLASDVKAEKVRWLWQHRIPLGEITILDGDPGVGKSSIALDIAARVTTGSPMPGEPTERSGPRGVVYVSLEDSPSHTLKPRLEAAGADLQRVRIVTAILGSDNSPHTPEIPGDLLDIEKAIQSVDAALLILDPLIACLTSETDSHKDQDVRRSIAPLESLAERRGVAVLGIRHLNKMKGGNALYRGGGSIAWIAGARMGLLAARDPDNPSYRVLAPTKSNLGPEPPALRYCIAPYQDIVRIEWTGESRHRAVNLLTDSEGEEGRSDLEDAITFLRVELSGGRVATTEIVKAGARLGYSPRTLERARSKLGVISKPHLDGGQRKWYLELPKAATEEAKTTPDGGVAVLTQAAEPGNVNSTTYTKTATPPTVARCSTPVAALPSNAGPPPDAPATQQEYAVAVRTPGRNRKAAS